MHYAFKVNKKGIHLGAFKVEHYISLLSLFKDVYNA